VKTPFARIWCNLAGKVYFVDEKKREITGNKELHAVEETS